MRRALAVAAAGAVLLGGTAAAGAATPYTDPAVSGALALCDGQGRLLTGGTLSDEPLAAKAVSDFVAPAPYRGTEAKVTLLVFQPRQGVAAGAWSGEPLTASSSFTDASHPSAEITYGDVTLKQAAEDYPPQWDGLLQLRLYTGAPNRPLYKEKYAAADVRITGGRWQLVHPVSLPCTSGRAVSVARRLAPASVTSPVATTAGAPRAAAVPTPTSASTERPAATPAPSTSAGSAPLSTTRPAAGSRSALVPGLLLAGLVVVASGVLVRRRLNAR